MIPPDGSIAHQRPRKATAADVETIQRIVRTAYAKYDERMDRPPGPVTRDYSEPVAAGDVWVIGEPLLGVICLSTDDVRLVPLRASARA